MILSPMTMRDVKMKTMVSRPTKPTSPAVAIGVTSDPTKRSTRTHGGDGPRGGKYGGGALGGVCGGLFGGMPGGAVGGGDPGGGARGGPGGGGLRVGLVTIETPCRRRRLGAEAPSSFECRVFAIRVFPVTWRRRRLLPQNFWKGRRRRRREVSTPSLINSGTADSVVSDVANSV